MPFYDFGQDLGEKVELNGFVDFGRSERRHGRCFVAEVVDTCLRIILIPKQSLYYVRGLRYGRKC